MCDLGSFYLFIRSSQVVEGNWRDLAKSVFGGWELLGKEGEGINGDEVGAFSSRPGNFSITK